jgi:SAM-dependent methyltransferase
VDDVDRLRPLADLVPILEAPNADFGHWETPPPRDGVGSLGWYAFGPTAAAWRAAVAAGDWIRAGFDWPAWMATDEGRTLRDDPAAVEAATPEQLARLITAIVRSDRFTEGSIAGAFESGLLARVSRRAAALLAASGEPSTGDSRMTDIAPDGSPVAFYSRLPATGEPELIDALVPRSASILDLGCGPGRIAGPLAALGHHVTGVDDGAGMIAALPPEVEGVVADARTVRLGRRFDAVLLASHLVNDPDGGPAFAATAAAHLEPRGIVIAETYPPDWDPAAGVGRETRLGDARITLLRALIDDDRLEAEVRYGVDDLEWTQPFTARILDEGALRKLLDDAGLAFERWLGRFVARPRPAR